MWEDQWTRAHARVDSQSPATGYWARCVLSARGRGCHEGATTFTHCRWAGEFRCWKIFSGRKLLFNVTEKGLGLGLGFVQSCGKANSRERMRVGGTYLIREKGGLILYMRPRGGV